MSDKKGVLPTVSEEVCFAVQAEIQQSKENDYVVDMLSRLQEDNPFIANFISTFSLKTSDPTSSTYAGLLVYRLLESQAQADKMEADTKI